MHRPASFHVFTWLVNIVTGKEEMKQINQGVLLVFATIVAIQGKGYFFLAYI